MSANNVRASTVSKTPVTQRLPRTSGQYAKPPAAAKIEFRQVQFGYWRAETPAHWLEIRLPRGPNDTTRMYVGRLIARPGCETLVEFKSGRFADVQRRLIAEQAIAANRPDAPVRALMTFEEFTDSADVEQKLARRADVYCRRWGVVQKSAKFTRSHINHRPTLILTIATEAIR